MQEVWQPLAEAGGPACPHCGLQVMNHNGERMFAVYWYIGDPAKAMTAG